MPEIITEPPSRRCSPAVSAAGTQEFQRLDPDLSLLTTRGTMEATGGRLRPPRSLFLAVFSLLSPLFLAVICLSRDAKNRTFPRHWPIFPAVFLWNNSEKQPEALT